MRRALTVCLPTYLDVCIMALLLLLCSIHLVASLYETLESSPLDRTAKAISQELVTSPTMEYSTSVVAKRDCFSSSLNGANCKLQELEKEIVNVKVEKMALFASSDNVKKKLGFPGQESKVLRKCSMVGFSSQRQKTKSERK